MADSGHETTEPSFPGGATLVQARLLAFMDRHGPKWFTLLELESIRLLGPDDMVAIPSLIEKGWAMYLAPLEAVALTGAGTTIADEIRSTPGWCEP